MSNRKRHTRLRRIGASLIVIALSSLALSCWPRPADPVTKPVIPKAPVVTESASPTMDKAGRKTSEADTQSAITEERVSRAKNAADEAKARMKTALEEADRLRKQKTASENELVALYNQLVAQDQKMGVLLIDLTGAQSSLAAERKLRKEANDLLADARAKVAARDAETALLRSQLDQANAQAETYFTSAKQAADAQAKSAAQAATAEGRVTTWFRIAMAMLGLFLFSVLAHIARFYLHI